MPEGTQYMITERQAAEVLGWSKATMRLYRRKGRGPTFYKIGRRVLYRPADLDDFVETRRVEQLNKIHEPASQALKRADLRSAAVHHNGKQSSLRRKQRLNSTKGS